MTGTSALNPAAAIDLVSASCSLLFALLWLFISRAPGWRSTRSLVLVCLTAGLYSLCDFTQTMPFSDLVVRWGGRISVGLAGLHCASWLLFLEARDQRTLGRFERAVAWTGVAVAGLALVPGLFFTDDFVRFDVAWLGATYRIPEPSPLGLVSLVYFLAAMATMTARVSRKWSEGWRWRSPIVGSLLVLGLAFHDSLAVARVITSPLLVDLGFLVAIVGSGVLELSRLVGDAQRLEQLSTQLEREVQARTSELTGLQQALSRTQKLAAIGQLAGGVAHEINNPTAVVLSNLRYVRGALQADGRVPDDAAEALEDASAATERIARIVRDLSDAGRVANRSLELPHQVCEVDEVVERALGALPGLVAGAPRPQLHGATHLRARVDDGVLEKALLSLLQNAATAVAQAAVPEIHLEVAARDGTVELVVRDNGRGMPVDAEERLFEPFFTTRALAQGLGLPVAKGLLHAQGGDLRFLGNTPQGTSFLVVVPRA